MAEQFQLFLLTSFEALGTLRVGFAIVENHVRSNTPGYDKRKTSNRKGPQRMTLFVTSNAERRRHMRYVCLGTDMENMTEGRVEEKALVMDGHL